MFVNSCYSEMRFDILIVVDMNTVFLWDMTPCGLTDGQTDTRVRDVIASIFRVEEISENTGSRFL